MSRSKAKKAKPGGGRLQTIGIFATLLAVAVLVGSLVAGMVGRGPAPAAPPPPAPQAAAKAPVGRVRVQVLNASGRAGLAREATGLLRDRGFDVVEFGNGKGFPPDSSIVLDRAGRAEMARQVADAVNIRRIAARPDSNLLLDVTVVLGRDWKP